MVQYVNGMSHPRATAMPGHNIAFPGHHLLHLVSLIPTSFPFTRHIHLSLAIDPFTVRIISLIDVLPVIITAVACLIWIL